jgi:hypothetical protein
MERKNHQNRHSVFFISTVLIIGLVSTGVIRAQSDEYADITFQVLLDPSLLSGEKATEITSAWMAYALARVGWIKKNIPADSVRDGTYLLTFTEEFEGRKGLVKVWEELKESNSELQDFYLDALHAVYKANFLREYIWLLLKESTWEKAPEGLRTNEFGEWCFQNLPEIPIETLATIKIEINKKR